MLRVIFDTNIYGLLALEKEESEIRKKIKQDRSNRIKDFSFMDLKRFIKS
ncbi:MAG: hypothetical protein Q8O03_09270 [Nanoarchaeota archaeon]|nr:hypothetical protein [Nanoarchaeota archaeon]